MGTKTGEPPQRMTSAEVLDHVEIVHGAFRPGRLAALCIVKDEMFFLPSLLDHYRSIGVEQFVLWDDGSTDGSAEYLQSQPDCVVLRCRFSYGTVIDVIDAPLRNTVVRVGVLARRFMAKKLGLEGWAVGIDADEFMLLPPGCSDLGALIGMLDARGLEVVTSSLVEFYPQRIWQPGSLPDPRTLDDLLRLYPFFDAQPLVDVRAGEAVVLAETASMRLFRTFGVRSPFPGYFPPSRLLKWLGGDPPQTPAHKSPLVKWSSDPLQPPSVAAPTDLLLCMAHFKFTHDLDRRTEGAVASRAYAANSLRYDCYDELIVRMRKYEALFMGPQSRAFESAADLMELGLMRIAAATGSAP